MHAIKPYNYGKYSRHTQHKVQPTKDPGLRFTKISQSHLQALQTGSIVERVQQHQSSVTRRYSISPCTCINCFGTMRMHGTPKCNFSLYYLWEVRWLLLISFFSGLASAGVGPSNWSCMLAWWIWAWNRSMEDTSAQSRERSLFSWLPSRGWRCRMSTSRGTSRIRSDPPLRRAGSHIQTATPTEPKTSRTIPVCSLCDSLLWLGTIAMI